MDRYRHCPAVCCCCWCRDVFEQCYNRLPRKLPLKFALPGAERQDSVFSGFQQIDAAAQVGGRQSTVWGTADAQTISNR